MKIDYDIHAHTHLSLCGEDSATIANYVKSAKRLGIKLIGIADHMWDLDVPFAESMSLSKGGIGVLDWYRAQGIEHCRQILKEIEETDTEGIKFIFGGEVDYCPGTGAAITTQHAEQLDFIVVPNSHTHHIMNRDCYKPYQRHADFMSNAIMEICTAPTAKYVTSLAHPFEAVSCPYPKEYIYEALTDSRLSEVFSAAKESNTAVEINSGAFLGMTDEQIRNCGYTRILSAAKKCGCKFTFGSDSHADGEQDSLYLAGKAADFIGLTPEDILTAEDILRR